METAATIEPFGTFDFHLSPKQEARAARLHHDSIIVDLLFSGPCGHRSFTQAMTQQLLERWEATRDSIGTLLAAIDLPVRLALRGQLPEFREIWDASGVTVGNRQVELATLEHFSGMFGIAQAQFDGFDWLRKALVVDDIRAAKAAGEHAGVVSTQLTTGPFPSWQVLESAYDLGLRMVQLTYNTMTPLGAGCSERTEAGVSALGAEAIRRMNEMGIVVDTGHCGHRTTMDACRISRGPVVASHSAAAALHDHDRCKSDEAIRAIAATGGVVGVVALPTFLGKGPDLSVETLLDHIDHIAGLVGAEHAALGTDWPMQIPDELMDVVSGLVRSLGATDYDIEDTPRTLAGFDDYRDYPNITRGLVARGYADEQIRGILGENFLRVFQAVCR